MGIVSTIWNFPLWSIRTFLQFLNEDNMQNTQQFPAPTVTAGDFVSIRAIYNRISFDIVKAARDKDKEKSDNLIHLVIALERCYPKEMETLRNE